MFKTRFISILVLLCLTVSGAWAQEGTLLTTILSDDNTDFKSGSKTFDNKATVTFSGNVDNYVGWGWYSMEGEATLTVTAAEGYTITRVKFYTNSGSAFDEEAPFEAILVLDLGNYKVFTKVNDTSIGESGVTQIDVYGYATPAASTYTVTLKEGTEDATSWTIAPDEATTTGVAAGTEVKATYGGAKKVKSVKAVKKAKPAATVTTAPTAKTGVKAGEDVAIVNEGAAEGGTMMYMVNATQPASTDGFSATVPTAEGLTAGTYYVWYYVKADDSHTDSEISATGIEVTIEAAGPKAAAEATAEDKGKLIGTDGKIYADVAAATAAGTTAVAKIIYIGTTGHATYSHGLALALNDEASKMAWQAAIDACSAKNTNTPVTGATWLLASQDQWNYMKGTSGAGSYTALRDGFSGITGASNLQSTFSTYYWSSTESSSTKAYDLSFNNGSWFNDKKSFDCQVRACLAF